MLPTKELQSIEELYANKQKTSGQRQLPVLQTHLAALLSKRLLLLELTY